MSNLRRVYIDVGVATGKIRVLVDMVHRAPPELMAEELNKIASTLDDCNPFILDSYADEMMKEEV